MVTLIFNKFRKYLVFIILIISEGIIFFIQNNETCFQYYKKNIYPPFSLLLRKIMSNVSFSVGDLIYLGCFICFFTYLIFIIYNLKYALIKKIYIYFYIKRIVVIFLIFHLIFKLFWGMNYANNEFMEKHPYPVKLEYNFSEVNKTRKHLIQQLNATRAEIHSIDIKNLTNEKIIHQAYHIFEDAGYKDSTFYMKKPVIKLSNFPEVVNIFGFSGYFNPFTNEAQIRFDNPLLLNLLICIHELTHQLGYSSEIEASFASEYICLTSHSSLFKYSSLCDLYLFFLSESYSFSDSAQCRNFLLEDDAYFSSDVRSEMNQIINKLQNQHQGFIYYSRKIFREFYNYFLILNNETQGLKSYDTIIGWYISFSKQEQKKKP